MERFGDMASQIPVVLVFLPVTASLIAFAKLVKTNVLSAFSFLNQMNGWILAGIAVVVIVLLILLSYAISVRIMEKKEF